MNATNEQTQLELEYLDALRSAEAIGARMISHGHTANRENSLSYTKLQEATLWAQKNAHEKAFRRAQVEAHDPGPISSGPED